MQKDIFPYIDIPVVTVVWGYTGISPNDIANRIVTISERAMTTTVNDIEHMESSSYTGVAVERLFFQPNVKIDLAYRPGHGDFADAAASFSAGHISAQRRQVRRFERAHSAAGREQQNL